MKTMILAIAISCSAAISSYAQTKDCSCKKKVAHHKTLRHTIAAKTTTSKPIPCYTYRKHNIVVTECPDDFSSNDGFNLENTYTGYYPETESSALKNAGIDESAALNNKQFTVSSTAFTNFGVIPAKYTCEGTKASPPLTINNIPSNAKSLAVVMYDPSATSKESLTYWLIWNIDPTQNIPENFVSDNESLNSAKEWGYQAACPASGTHYYHFIVYALDTKLLLNRYTTKGALERAMTGHVLAEDELVGTYNRHLD
jgi:Raf kinase inhibitor-like YbhB/YbcL family protein